MPNDAVLYKRQGRTAYITLNRPQVLNAVNRDLESGLIDALRQFDADEEAWVAVLHGAGRAFCAGADIKQSFHGASRQERDRQWGAGISPDGLLGRTINWKPVIAAVHGHCLGWGILIAAECDLVVASQEAMFGLTETLRGFPGGPAWARLNAFMPSKIATEMLLTGQAKPAADLHRLGFINRLTPTGGHLDAAQSLADEVLKAPPLAVRSGVRVTRWQWSRSAAEADYYQAALRLHLTEDFEESSRSFVEKRPPEYKGR
jgi:enoyl-CoA hydratase/carnithine racemase